MRSHISVKGKNQARFIRLSSLEEGYTEADLRAHFLGQQEHKPREKNNHRTDACPFNLVIDIQSKLQNKGAGYQRWASVYNLKQMSKTLLFLRDHKIENMEQLDQLVRQQTAKRDALLALFHMVVECKELPLLIKAILEGIPARKEENEILKERFLHQRNLLRNGKVIFPQKIVYLFPDIEKPDLAMFSTMDGFTDFVDNACLFKDFWKDAQKDKTYLDSFLWGHEGHPCISEDLIPDIINRVAPEYTIPQAKAAIETPKQSKNHDLDRTLLIGKYDKETGKRFWGFWED